jgi:RNA polymerase sigma factor (sigma-70 family)
MKPLPESQAVLPIALGGALGVAGDAPPRASDAPRALSLPLPALRLVSDERLARLARAGDRAAFGVIFNRYHRELHRYCFSILGNADDAGDALQSTMLRALSALEGDTREIVLRPWLHRIARNESITLLRRHRHTAVDSDIALPALPAQLDGEASVELRAKLHELLSDLRELPELQRGALVMRELAGLDYPEIAAVLDTTPAGAKQATYDARRALLELARGREMDCAAVCTVVSDGDGRALRGRALRAHLRACGDCREFRVAIADRRSKLAALVPSVPTGLLEGVLGSAGGGAGLYAGFGIAAKSLATLALVAALGAGAFEAVGPGGGSGAASGGGASPAVPSSAPTLPPRAVQPEPRASRARHVSSHHGAAAGARRHKLQRSAGGAPARDAAPRAAPPGTRHAAGPGAEQPGTSTAPGTARSRSGGPIRHIISRSTGEHPVRGGVGAVGDVALPTVAQVQDALPVKTPPLPVHP